MNTHKRSGRPTSYNTDFKNWLKTNDNVTYNTIFNGLKGRKTYDIKKLEYNKIKEYNSYLNKLKEDSEKMLNKVKEE